MAERAEQPVSAPTSPEANSETAVIRTDIERTRAEMSRTVNEIEERLSPAHLKEQAVDLKEVVIGQYHEVKDHVKDDLAREFQTVKSKLQEEVQEAKKVVQEEVRSVRTAVQEQVQQTKTAIREATVGRVEHMVHDARETVTEAGTTVVDTIRQNPIPAALIAVGLGWLILGGRQGGSDRRIRVRGVRRDLGYGYGYDDDFGYRGDDVYGERRPRTGSRFDGRYDRGAEPLLRQGKRAVGEALHTAEEGVSNLGRRAQAAGHRVQEGASHLAEQAQGAVHDVGESVGQVAHRVGERVEHLAHDARDTVAHLAEDARVTGRRAIQSTERQYHRAEIQVQNAMTDNPLAVGAVAFALGAAIGLSLPHTATEDEWMGEAKERLIERAEGVAHEALHKVEEKVGELAGLGGQEQQSEKAQPKRSQNNGNRTGAQTA
ncbi:DUF3618 domain-containing protein [Sorangium sp. So ce269]